MVIAGGHSFVIRLSSAETLGSIRQSRSKACQAAG